MNKSSRFAVAQIALAVVLCAAVALASVDDGEHDDWNCGTVGGEAAEYAGDVPLVWTNKNDKICKGVCRKEGVHPVYKKGNYALFTDGLYCCCSIRRLFTASRHPYGVTTPHISYRMAEKLGLASEDPPTD